MKRTQIIIVLIVLLISLLVPLLLPPVHGQVIVPPTFTAELVPVKWSCDEIVIALAGEPIPDTGIDTYMMMTLNPVHVIQLDFDWETYEYRGRVPEGLGVWNVAWYAAYFFDFSDGYSFWISRTVQLPNDGWCTRIGVPEVFMP